MPPEWPPKAAEGLKCVLCGLPVRRESKKIVVAEVVGRT
jgi:hypothetical protein